MPSFQQKITGNTRNKKVWSIYKEGGRGEAVNGNNPWGSPEFGLKKNENYASQTGELRHFQVNKNRDFVASGPALKEILRSPSGRNTRTPNSNSDPREEVAAWGQLSKFSESHRQKAARGSSRAPERLRVQDAGDRDPSIGETAYILSCQCLYIFIFFHNKLNKERRTSITLRGKCFKYIYLKGLSDITAFLIWIGPQSYLHTFYFVQPF